MILMQELHFFKTDRLNCCWLWRQLNDLLSMVLGIKTNVIPKCLYCLICISWTSYYVRLSWSGSGILFTVYYILGNSCRCLCQVLFSIRSTSALTLLTTKTLTMNYFHFYDKNIVWNEIIVIRSLINERQEI